MPIKHLSVWFEIHSKSKFDISWFMKQKIIKLKAKCATLTVLKAHVTKIHEMKKEIPKCNNCGNKIQSLKNHMWTIHLSKWRNVYHSLFPLKLVSSWNFQNLESQIKTFFNLQIGGTLKNVETNQNGISSEKWANVGVFLTKFFNFPKQVPRILKLRIFARAEVAWFVYKMFPLNNYFSWICLWSFSNRKRILSKVLSKQ